MRETCVKRQHYLPKFYLERFTDDSGRIFSLHRNNFEIPKRIINTSPKDCCVKKDFYEVRSTKGYVERNSIESWLSLAESHLSSKIRDLSNLDLHKGDEFPVQGQDLLSALSVFAANLIVRNPKWILPEREKSEEITAELKRADFFTRHDMEKLHELGYASDLNSVVEFSIQCAAITMFENGSPMRELSVAFNSMNVTLIKAPVGSSFITTSFPFVFEWDSVDDKRPSMVYLPLCKHTAIFLMKAASDNRWLRCVHIPVDDVIKLNQAIIMKNDMWDSLFSPSAGILKSLSHSCQKMGYIKNKNR